MHRFRATRAPLLAILVCMLLAAPALAAVPDRDAEGNAPRPERPSWTEAVRDVVLSIAERLGVSVREKPPTKSGRTPGPVIDPDGHKPTTK